MGQNHKPPPGVRVSVAVRQEVFALGSLRFSKHGTGELEENGESPPAIKVQSFCDASMQIVVKIKISSLY